MPKKLIQFIGTRNKSDFVLYLSHVLTSLNKRVLIVDGTHNELYRHGFTRGESQQLFDFQGIDILTKAASWIDIDQKLKAADESIENYDVVVMDIDTTELLEQHWPMFNEHFYVGDFDRANQLRDTDLIRTLLRTTGSNELKRITFDSDYPIDEEYFEMQLNEEINWRSMNYKFKEDEINEVLRLRMQHEQVIPYKNLSKQYKELLTEIISALYELHVQDIKDAVKPSFFKFPFKRDNREVSSTI